MKILVINGDCITFNSSANLCHLAYIKGLVDSGHDVTLLSSDGKNYEHDKSMVIPAQVKCYSYDGMSENQKEAWVFLKWWTEAQTQLDYNNNIESIIGATARVPLATKDAFEQLAWDPADLPVLMEQFSMIKEIPEVPGSYYVSRAVDQAFWNVVNNGNNHKDVLINWSKIANEEIARKIKEYN